MRALLPLLIALIGVALTVAGLVVVFGAWALVGSGLVVSGLGVFVIDDGRPQ